jgi:hypothetical protein
LNAKCRGPLGQITSHSIRTLVMLILDMGYVDYSEYFMGHSGSTYWRKKDIKEKYFAKSSRI